MYIFFVCKILLLYHFNIIVTIRVFILKDTFVGCIWFNDRHENIVLILRPNRFSRRDVSSPLKAFEDGSGLHWNTPALDLGFFDLFFFVNAPLGTGDLFWTDSRWECYFIFSKFVYFTNDYNHNNIYFLITT